MYKIHIVEGGTGLVHKEDPAWAYCQMLSTAGYDTIWLTLRTFMGGVAGHYALSLMDQLGVASLTDQTATLKGQGRDIPCTHHWVLDTPISGNRTVPGKCKLCKEEKDFKVHASVVGDEDAGTESLLVRASKWDSQVDAYEGYHPWQQE